jgi:hypothetical protein
MRGAIIAGGSIPTTPGGLMHLRATCSASCARPAARAARSPAGTKIALETGTSAFFVARELARLNLKP